MRAAVFHLLALAGAVMWPATSWGSAVFDPGDFTAPTVIDYSSSPVGVIPPGNPVIDQYLSLGVVHDGHTTTPPGPPGMSSLSGLPALEAGAVGVAVPPRVIEISFATPISEVGAFYLMGGATNSMTLSALASDGSVIESVTVLAEEMPLAPGPYGFNEGFVGLITQEPIAAARFESVDLTFVIDDLHFGIPEPATILLLALGALALVRLRR
ncbi:MAG: PEP-CTERM sorting domain-containing protein [Planctomycetes bacterium]|nr:PEP-CTERM sorting domain-containing protein [Planctomycetota bacterium]